MSLIDRLGGVSQPLMTKPLNLDLRCMSPKALARLIYIDDSGDPSSGLIVYGWVEFQPHRWHDVLGEWLSHRKQLWEHYGVPVPAELHMTSYALGRGRISRQLPAEFITENGAELWKDFGRAVARKSLETLHSIGGAACRRGLPTGHTRDVGNRASRGLRQTPRPIRGRYGAK